jgi:hypothetical protein
MYFTKIITLYPASELTESCLRADHRVLGTWVFKEVGTTDFCGDQMFSGHTNNTLLPMIILTRILYDIIGWDFRLRKPKDDYHTEDYTRVYAVAETAPAVHPTFTDNNHDIWFHPRPLGGGKWRDNRALVVLVWSLVVFWRIAKWVIFAVFAYGLLRIRQHYTADILVSVIVQIFVLTNTRYMQALVRWIYRPNYWNYKRTGLFTFVKLRQPLTSEQVNYEERVDKVGRGGVF